MEKNDFIIADQYNAHIAVNILAEAFQGDPMVTWTSKHKDYPLFLYSMVMPFYLKHGLVVFNRDLSSAYMALKPNVKAKFSPKVSEVIRFFIKFGPVALYRILKFSNTIETHHYQNSHYYLFSIGTTLATRKTHKGSSILRHLIGLAEKRNVAIYTENSNPKDNTVFYNHMGFESGNGFKVSRNSPQIVPILFKPGKLKT